MMKNTQKKLKAKHFRYLSKDIIKNPMIYLREYFWNHTNIFYWQNDINLFVTCGAYPTMSNGDDTENGFHCKKMIQQIEVAYVIFKQCGLPKHRNPLQLFDKREDYYNYTHDFEFTSHGKRNPHELISKFFSFQTLRKWYETMDELMQQLTLKKANDHDQFGDKIVAIRELLIRLAYALYYIYEDQGLILPVPSYVKTEPAETAKCLKE